MSGNPIQLLRKLYPPEAYVLLEEVRNGTGTMQQARSADALAVGLWPSRGLGCTGFELKCHRGDWLREARNPAKAEAVFQYCRQWYLVSTAPHVVMSRDEIPEAWGWIDCSGEKAAVKKRAPELSPQPYTAQFLGAILRRYSAGKIHESELEAAVEARVKLDIEASKADAARRLAHAEREIASLKAERRAFEEASGITIASPWRGTGWGNPQAVGNAVAEILRIGGTEAIKRVVRAHDVAQAAEGARGRIADALALFDRAIKLAREGVEA